MSVQSTTQELENLLSNFQKARAKILSNSDWTPQKKTADSATLFTETCKKAESLFATLWGELPEDSVLLSSSGEVWVALDVAETRLSNDRDAFMGSRYSNPALLPLLKDRAASLAAQAREARDFYASYDASEPDLKSYIQDTQGTILLGKVSRDWAQIKGQISRERDAAVAEAEAPAREQKQVVFDQLDVAYKVTKLIAHEFGRNSLPLTLTMKGIGYSREINRLGIVTQFERQPFRPMVNYGSGRVTHFG